MKTFRIVSIIVLSSAFLVVAVLFLIGYFKPVPGGILVDTTPASSVYVDDKLVGRTPYQGSFKTSQITIKLVPIDTKELLTYTTKINLTPGTQTVVRREFGKNEDESSGDVISFEKDSGNTSLIVITTPDNSQVMVDGVVRGFAPYKNTNILEGQHEITVKSIGYTDRTMTVRTLRNFRLTIFAKLGKVVEPSPTPTPISNVSVFVEILDTPTGFLRVRTEPGAKGEEIAEVKPGSKYVYLDTDADTGWFKIQYEEVKPGLPNGIVGWVSNQFSKKVEDVATP